MDMSYTNIKKFNFELATKTAKAMSKGNCQSREEVW